MKLYNWNDVAVNQSDSGITRQLITFENMMLAQIFYPERHVLSRTQDIE